MLLVLSIGLAQVPPNAPRRRFGMDINDASPIVRTEGPSGQGGPFINENSVRTAREVAAHSTDPLIWTNDPAFSEDVFTFTRMIYKYGKGPRISKTASPWGWVTDFPDSDLNLSFRLQQMTSMKVSPDGRVLKLTDPALTDYPWLYVVEPGRMQLRDEEVPVLRKYLLNGGFLMADDFWGQKHWDNFEYEIKRALPDHEFVELPMDHPLFHTVFDLKGPKNKLQTPVSLFAKNSLDPASPTYGMTWEYDHYDDYTPDGAKDMHVRAMFDDKGRMMIVATHNCDNGDGWEREGEDDAFFHAFSENRAFPLGINIIVYAMTH